MRTRRRPTARGIILATGFGLAAWLVQRSGKADLDGQVALVTGGSRGLGLLLSRELGQQGCKLAICARDDAQLETAQADLQRRGLDVLTVRCDVGNREEVERLLDQATRHFGRIDILVNNAGLISVGPVETMTLEDFEAALNVMYWGVVYPTLAVLPQMLERRSGRIVNVTSIGGKVSVPHLLAYNSAKFAAVGFSEGLRAELAGTGISVTTVVPGLMRTGSHVNAFVKGKQEAEYAWFAPAASLPFISIDGERAARQIVEAASRGSSEITLTLPANLLARAHGLFPGAVTGVLGLVDRVLPAPDGHGTAMARGLEVEQRLRLPLFGTITAWGRSAAERFNQLPALRS